jgi:hypothetical protein
MSAAKGQPSFGPVKEKKNKSVKKTVAKIGKQHSK